MIVAIGVDNVSIPRIEAMLARARFAERTFTAAERDYCAKRARPAESFAARFCAKEAAMKCLGTGWTQGVRFLDLEVVRDPQGAVALQLHGEAARIAASLGIRRWHLSLTHTDGTATAFVVAEG